MANYANTKAIIAQNIYTNHTGQVTAEMVKTAANEIVNTLIAGGYLYAGVAKLTPTQTNPGSPDANVFYIATEPGTYTNFVGAGGSLVVADGEVAVFKFNGTWSKEVTGIAPKSLAKRADEKVLKLASLNASMGDVNVGDYYYNPNLASIRLKVSNSENIEVPFYDGAVYTYNHNLYIWNGGRFVQKTDNETSQIDATTGNVSISRDNVLQYIVAGADKLVKLDAFTSSPSSLPVGSVYYNPTNKIIRRKTGASTYEIIPYYTGAIYTFNGYLFVWDGSNLISKTEECIRFDDFPEWEQIADSPRDDYALVGDGYSVYEPTAQMLKYAVLPGDMLIVSLSKDNGGVYQFQNSPSVSTSGEAQLERLVGDPVTETTRGVLVVPAGASYLIVSQNKGNTTNQVRVLYRPEKNVRTIIERTERQIQNVFACSDWKRVSTITGWRDKIFAMMMCSDLHADADRFANAIYLLNNCEAIDAGIFLGDMENNSGQTGTFIPTTLVPAVNDSDKVILCAMGNHDQRRNETDTITCEQSVARYMGATKNRSDYTARGYGYHDFANRKIRVIILNPYDYTNDPEATDPDVMAQFGDSLMYQQAQIDWFVNTLNSVPDGYSVIVATHYPGPTQTDNNVINRHLNLNCVLGSTIVGEIGYQNGDVISDIIQAYINRGTLTQNYNYQSVTASIHGVYFTHTCPSASMPAYIAVDADFSNAKGRFACTIFGHIHSQMWGHNVAHNNQGAYGNDTSCCWTPVSGYQHLAPSIIPRDKNGASQDLLTIMCVDNDNRVIHFVRVGANMTFLGEVYDVVSVDF